MITANVSLFGFIRHGSFLQATMPEQLFEVATCILRTRQYGASRQAKTWYEGVSCQDASEALCFIACWANVLYAVLIPGLLSLIVLCIFFSPLSNFSHVATAISALSSTVAVSIALALMTAIVNKTLGIYLRALAVAVQQIAT